MLVEKINKLSGLHINTFLCHVKSYPKHMHDTHEIIFVLEGSVNIQCACFNYHLTKGDIFIVDTNELHSIFETEEKNLLLIFQLDPYPYLNLFPKLDYYDFVCDSYSDTNKSYIELRNLQSSLADILLLIQEKRSDAHDLIEASIIKLIKLLINDFQFIYIDETGYHSNSTFKNNPVQMERIFIILKYMYRNYKQKIDMDMLSNTIHLDKSYVSRLFKIGTGLNMTDFLCFLRVKYSESLLISSSMSIDEIAFKFGFSSKRYYVKHFLKWYKMKPAEYRDNYKKLMSEISNDVQYHEINYDNALKSLKGFQVKK
ncbi:MAG: AraC family transcriptional regulator [Clostridia bacterium]|nr:AraC family transcriptional regulator [Clostridia bacterium]